MADFDFTFDPSNILNGIGKVNKKLDGMEGGFKDSAASMGKAITGGVLKAKILFAGLSAAFKGAINVIKDTAPEIGQTISIAKDTFFKNFLYPIRKELAPVLQNLLDWTRENRGRFVKWGKAAVSVVKSVVKAVTGLVGVIKQIGGNLLSWMGFDSIEEAISVIQFKIAVVTIAIKAMLGDTGQYLSGLWARVGDDFSGLASSLLSNFQTIGGDILSWAKTFSQSFLSNFDFGATLEDAISLYRRLSDVAGELWEAMFGGGKSEKWENFFSGLGKLTGGALSVLTNGVAALYRVMTNFIENVIESPSFDKFLSFLSDAADIIGSITGNVGDKLLGLADRLSAIGRTPVSASIEYSDSIDDGIVKPDGTVVKTNPEDTIIATKSNLFRMGAAEAAASTNTQRTVNNTGGNVFHMTPSIVIYANSEEEGRAAGQGVMDQIFEQYNKEYVRGGA